MTSEIHHLHLKFAFFLWLFFNGGWTFGESSNIKSFQIWWISETKPLVSTLRLWSSISAKWGEMLYMNIHKTNIKKTKQNKKQKKTKKNNNNNKKKFTSQPLQGHQLSPAVMVQPFVDTLLQPISKIRKSYLKDITDFINFIENTKVKKRTFLVSMDVKSLLKYTTERGHWNCL